MQTQDRKKEMIYFWNRSEIISSLLGLVHLHASMAKFHNMEPSTGLKLHNIKPPDRQDSGGYWASSNYMCESSTTPGISQPAIMCPHKNLQLLNHRSIHHSTTPTESVKGCRQAGGRLEGQSYCRCQTLSRRTRSVWNSMLSLGEETYRMHSSSKITQLYRA